MAHKTMAGDCINNNSTEGSMLQRKGLYFVGRGRCMKNITGVGFICLGVNINACCFYGSREWGKRYSINLKGS
jgi:hypothetical protein